MGKIKDIVVGGKGKSEKTFSLSNNKMSIDGENIVDCNSQSINDTMSEILRSDVSSKFYQKAPIAYAFKGNVNGMVFGLSEYPYKLMSL